MPVTCCSRPPTLVALKNLLADDGSVRVDHSISVVPLMGGHELDTAVAVPIVVLDRKKMPPTD